MQIAIIWFVIGSFSASLFAFIVGRILYKAKVVEYMQSCDYKECKRYCEVERELGVVINNNKKILHDTKEILCQRNKFAKDIAERLK